MNKEERYKSLIEEIKLGILKHTIWLQNRQNLNSERLLQTTEKDLSRMLEYIEMEIDFIENAENRLNKSIEEYLKDFGDIREA